MSRVQLLDKFDLTLIQFDGTPAKIISAVAVGYLPIFVFDHPEAFVRLVIWAIISGALYVALFERTILGADPWKKFTKALRRELRQLLDGTNDKPQPI